ncbi:MAG TPA: YlxR family protein [Solirubrobacteraceae bacterium]|nr:YlxR family protein [Solirubrobacteraceae bacterium]
MACRRVAPKTALHRLVAGEGGVIAVDAAGTRPGRGAYVCDAACHAEATRRGAYGRALRRRVTVPDGLVPPARVTAASQPPGHLS